jgi:hypothetical protein
MNIAPRNRKDCLFAVTSYTSSLGELKGMLHGGLFARFFDF